MFDYIKGTLADASPLKVTLDVQGIGYLLSIPFNNYGQLPKIGTTLTLFVASVIREDSHRNYGFLTREQRDLFESLIDVSGIGPKTALALLGHMEIADLHLAIAQEKIDIICKIPGIGKKTAERLVVEMRDKIKKLHDKLPITSETKGQGVISDALSALINLGYNPAQAQKALKTASETAGKEPDLARLITAALRCI